MQIKTKKILAILLAGMMALSAAACSPVGKPEESAATSQTSASAETPPSETQADQTAAAASAAQTAETSASASGTDAATSASAPDAAAATAAPEASAAPAAAQEAPDTTQPADAQEAAAAAPVAKNGEIYILFTSDVHCGINQHFGYASLKQVRDTLEAKGYETLLVDDGDSIQGEAIGTLTKGDVIIDLMNDIKYDVAIPGNHEYDYGTETFLELTKKANFPYICCNFMHQGELVFKPYIVLEAAGKKIGFVGVTTPTTITTSSPKNFQNEKGEYIYSFMEEDRTGGEVYQAVQNAANAARAEGADFVYLVAHLGNIDACSPWTYADVIANTSGIDVCLDGHSHDTDQIVMKNKNGEEVTRSAVGTKMNCIGYSHITADGTIKETGIWTWPSKDPAPELLDIRNEMRDEVDSAEHAFDEQLKQVVAVTTVELTINDPKEVDTSGNPVRMVRRAETNLGDLCADAYRYQSGTDIALVNGGSIRTSIEKGDITNEEIIGVHPFGNSLVVLEVTGQQVLDALEWGSRAVPGENGGFLQVSGLSYEINTAVESSCTQDEHELFSGVKGKRRVQNVMVGDEPLDPKKKYTLASQSYLLREKGDGFSMFEGDPVLQDGVKLDNQVLLGYIVDTLGGKIGEEYADPYGQGRITILE